MITGLIFDIREFTIHDGPGIRTTIFFKGCPLNCVWCHNPEGKRHFPEMMRTLNGERRVGKEYTPDELARYLNGQAYILRTNEGGVTLSGGEPLLQGPFIHATLDLLDDLHILLDTSGYSDAHTFEKLIARCQMVYLDLKLMDEQAHKQYTGQSNRPILENLQLLSRSGVPYVIRVPLIPGITDTEDNLTAIADTVRDLPGLLRVDLLPYNPFAGAKYPLLGMDYALHAIENQAVNIRSDIFESRGIEVTVQ